MPANTKCCEDENILFKMAFLSPGVPADGAPLDAYFDDLIGVAHGTEGSRPLESPLDECKNPRLAFGQGLTSWVE